MSSTISNDARKDRLATRDNEQDECEPYDPSNCPIVVGTVRGR